MPLLYSPEKQFLIIPVLMMAVVKMAVVSLKVWDE
jgi:hypothetical protein